MLLCITQGITALAVFMTEHLNASQTNSSFKFIIKDLLLGPTREDYVVCVWPT